MAVNYSKHFNTKVVPQTQPVPGKGMKKNSAGGFSFGVNDWTQLQRFLILGSEGGSYYASAKSLTVENAEALVRCAKSDGRRTVDMIVETSKSGRAPKNDPALFALAVCAGLDGLDPSTKTYALSKLSEVARIPTHLFTFLDNVEGFRGWGRGLREGVANWYNSKDLKTLAYQMVKYRQRGGWSHRDVLRKSHPRTLEQARSALYALAANNFSGEVGENHQILTERRLPKASRESLVEKASVVVPGQDEFRVVEGFLRAQKATSVAEVVRLVQDYRLTREMVPTDYAGKPEVMEALLPNMPLNALIRNLGNLTRLGVVENFSENLKLVESKLASDKAIRDARVHPIALLNALNVYNAGGTLGKSKNTWTPVQRIVDALDAAFYTAFNAITPTNKRLMLALDVSGSMSWNNIAGCEGLTPRVASAAMALVTANVEKDHGIYSFSTGLSELSISPRMRMNDVIRKVSNLNFGGTDCALPMVWAKKNKVDVDAFVIYTDSETWYGSIHPFQALKEYRNATGINAKLIVVGMVANKFSIADPSDSGMLDVVGFDTATPQLMSEFILGNI